MLKQPQSTKGYKMNKISAYIVTKNEEARLPKTLKALRQVADEIIIVDSGSTDKTPEIAKKYGAKFIFHKWKNISSQKNFASLQCQNDWLLSLDADEVLSPKLIKEIQDLKKNMSMDAYRLRIRDMYPGDKKPQHFAKSYNLIRLYNKKAGEMPDDLTHDRVIMKKNAKVGQLKEVIYHYSYLSIERTVEKLNIYTTELISTAKATGKKYSLFRLFIEFPYQFIRYYFFKRFFLRGIFGFILSMNCAYFRFLKIAKYIERNKLEN